MAIVAPVQSGSPVLVSLAVIVLAPIVFILGWMAGMRMFAVSCESYRRMAPRVRLDYVLALLLVAVVVIALLAGGYWWLLAVTLAFLGHRKGTQCAYWSAVGTLAWVLRNPGPLGPSLVETDEEALSTAAEVITGEFASRPRTSA
jgi:hypothetical protein